jgi:hypothetical protein
LYGNLSPRSKEGASAIVFIAGDNDDDDDDIIKMKS